MRISSSLISKRKPHIEFDERVTYINHRSQKIRRSPFNLRGQAQVLVKIVRHARLHLRTKKQRMSKFAVRAERAENFQPEIPRLAKFIFENDVTLAKMKIRNVGEKCQPPRISESPSNRKFFLGNPSSRAFKNKIVLIVIAGIFLQPICSRAAQPPFASIRMKDERNPLCAESRVQNIFFNLNRGKSQKRRKVKIVFGRKKSLVVPDAATETPRQIELQIMLGLLIFVWKKICGKREIQRQKRYDEKCQRDFFHFEIIGDDRT